MWFGGGGYLFDTHQYILIVTIKLRIRCVYYIEIRVFIQYWYSKIKVLEKKPWSYSESSIVSSNHSESWPETVVNIWGYHLMRRLTLFLGKGFQINHRQKCFKTFLRDYKAQVPDEIDIYFVQQNISLCLNWTCMYWVITPSLSTISVLMTLCHISCLWRCARSVTTASVTTAVEGANHGSPGVPAI